MKFLFIFAHPDDESLSSGGTISKLTKKGHTVKLITATFGEAGQLGFPPITHRDKLALVRKKELECAAEILGISEIFFLGLADGKLKESFSKLKSLIQPIIISEKPDIVVTFDKSGGSNHPDHIITSKAVTEVFSIYLKNTDKHIQLYHTAFPRSLIKKISGTELEYKSFGKVMGVPDKEITTVIDIPDTFELKIEAAKCHQTQKKDWIRILKRHEFLNIKKEYFQLISENSFI